MRPLARSLSVLAGLIAVVSALYMVLPAAQAAEAQPRIRWGYHVNFDSHSGLASLRQHAGKLTHLAPRWYTLDAAGTLAPLPDPNRAALIAVARANGVKLVPYVRNIAKWHELTPFFDRPEARARAVASIAAAVTAENFDGIHIDFEEISPSDRGKLTEFIGELAAAMHQRGKLMSQAMGPKLNDAPTGWGASWDYAALGKLNDIVVIMAYTAPTNKPHPIAAAPWVEQNIAYTLSKIPAEKVVLGLPYYGYDWNLTKGDTGIALTGPIALRYAAEQGVTPQWNAAEQEHSYRYTVNGEQHEVWYSDRRSHEVRLGMVTARGLAGAAFWRIGQEEPGVWELLAPSAPPPATATAATTATAVPATATAMATAVPATATAVPATTPTRTPQPAATVTPLPTATPTPASTATAAPTTTPTVEATATSVPATATVTAVPPVPASSGPAPVESTPTPPADAAVGNVAIAGSVTSAPDGWPTLIGFSLASVAVIGGSGWWWRRRGRGRMS